MDIERKNATTLKGNPFTLVGPEIKVGQQAPEFTALAGDLSPVTLAGSKGKTRLFNEESSKLPGVEILVISVDLPFAQGRFCQTAGIKNVKCLSDHRDVSFGRAYGTLIKELRLLSRAIFIIGPDDKVQYVEYVPDVASHPNYDAALNALKQKASA